MEIIKYKPEGLKPGVTLDVFENTFEIYGKSCPENAVEFYQPILEWLNDYKNDALDKTVFEFRLQYYNTASSKVIFAVLRKLEAIYETGKDVLIKWIYPEDDESLEEAGEEYCDLIDAPIEMISMSVDDEEFVDNED